MASALVEDSPQVIKQGYLKKKAEYLKDWRWRYFILKDNGEFIGYQKEPSEEKDLDKVTNNFTVKNCKILMIDNQPKKFTFVIRGLHLTTVVERTFHVDSREERQSWINAIEKVKQKLENREIVNTEEISDPMHPFSRQGRTRNQSGQQRVTFDNFEFLKVLGKGGFGKVVLCRERATNKLYAMKMLKIEAIIRNDEMEHTMAEKRVLQRVKHPFLLKLKYSFTTVDRLCLVTEFVNGGDLYFHLVKDGTFSEERSKFYSAEIVCAVEYLHNNDIIHRDLKLENLLLDKDGHIKIADFGICKEGVGIGETTGTVCGTIEYLAPEILNDHTYGSCVDWWSLGIILYEMLIGRHPFGYNSETMIPKILQNDIIFPAFANISAKAKAILFGLLMKNPTERLGGGPGGAEEIKQHDFFSDTIWNELEQKRITPPFVPTVLTETDTQNFDVEFTGESVTLTPPNEDQNPLSFTTMRFSQFSYFAVDD